MSMGNNVNNNNNNVRKTIIPCQTCYGEQVNEAQSFSVNVNNASWWALLLLFSVIFEMTKDKSTNSKQIENEKIQKDVKNS